jgi:hypothetical protein
MAYWRELWRIISSSEVRFMWDITVPKPFTCRDIACIKVELNLILRLAKLHGSAIMAFVHILVYILDSLD